MKLQQLFESEEFNLSKFIEEVRPFLDVCMNAGSMTDQSRPFLYHGSYDLAAASKPFTKKQFSLRAKPRDSSVEAFNAANEWTKQNYGIEPRRWLFTTSVRSTTGSYGEARMIFPIGNFDYFYISEIEDFQIYMRDHYDELRIGRGYESVNVQNEVKYILTGAKKHNQVKHNKEIGIALKHGYEIMLNGGSFYALMQPFLYEQLTKPFFNPRLNEYHEWLCAQFGINQ